MAPKLKRTLALALAGGSLAIGVPAALAAGGDGDPASGSTAPSGPALVQDEGGQQQRPDREDCPERDGGGGAERSAPAEAPSV